MSTLQGVSSAVILTLWIFFFLPHSSIFILYTSISPRHTYFYQRPVQIGRQSNFYQIDYYTHYRSPKMALKHKLTTSSGRPTKKRTTGATQTDRLLENTVSMGNVHGSYNSLIIDVELAVREIVRANATSTTTSIVHKRCSFTNISFCWRLCFIVRVKETFRMLVACQSRQQSWHRWCRYETFLLSIIQRSNRLEILLGIIRSIEMILERLAAAAKTSGLSACDSSTWRTSI